MTGHQHPLDSSKLLAQRLDVDFALQAAGLGVWEVDQITSQVIWDERCRQLFGLATDNRLSYQQVIQYIHPEDRDQVDQAVQWALNPQSDGVYDQTFRTLGADDGQLRWVHAFGRSYFTPAGELYRFSGLAHDTTQQVLSRQKLLQSEQTLRIVLDNAPPAVSIGLFLGRDLRVHPLNQAFIDTIAKGNDIEGKPLRELMPELENQPFLHLLDQVYTTGQAHQSFGQPATIVQQGVWVQHYFNISFSPLRDAGGQVYGILDISFNVTPQVLAQQAHDQQQAHHRFILQLSDSLRALSDPLAMYYQTACLVGEYLGAHRVGYAEDQGDGDTIVVLRNYVNGVADLQGTYSYADYGPLLAEFQAGRTVVRPDIANDPTLTAAQKEAHRVLQLGATLNKPLMKDGRLVAVLFIHYGQAHPWSAQELSLLEMVAERLEMTLDRIQAEAALRQSEERYRQLSQALESQVHQRTEELAAANQALALMNEELTTSNEAYGLTNEELTEANLLLKRSNENLRQFAYVASHDLQEPLRKIQAFGDLLQNEYAAGLGQGVNYLQRMQSAAARMSTLIKDLLDYSRISTQREVNGLVPLDTLVEGALSSLELSIKELGAQIQVGPLPTVSGDDSQLHQLFQNLLGNALKFHRPGLAPFVEVRASKVASGELPQGIKPARAAMVYHRIDVADNGVGFEEKYLDRIFLVFQRLHGRSAYAGTGIGLAICEKVVSNHGGAITASSQVGQGATFTIYLPE